MSTEFPEFPGDWPTTAAQRNSREKREKQSGFRSRAERSNKTGWTPAKMVQKDQGSGVRLLMEACLASFSWFGQANFARRFPVT
jgi:hypothetical protein